MDIFISARLEKGIRPGFQKEFGQSSDKELGMVLDRILKSLVNDEDSSKDMSGCFIVPTIYGCISSVRVRVFLPPLSVPNTRHAFIDSMTNCNFYVRI